MIGGKISLSVQLLYTDDSLVVCEKPAGISSESPGLPDLIREQEGYAVFPVHRLDLTTGGVCLLARSSSVCTELQRMFQQAQVIKEYYAVVYGVTDSVTGVFEDLLYHDVKTNKTFVVRTERKGVKRASCKWTALQTTETAEGLMTLLKIRLHTGRTHQIRVQFASRKMPLIGDRRYGSRIKAPFPALW